MSCRPSLIFDVPLGEEGLEPRTALSSANRALQRTFDGILNVRNRESRFRGGVDELKWRRHDGSLGLEAARRLLCPRLEATARYLEREATAAGTSSLYFTGEKPKEPIP